MLTLTLAYIVCVLCVCAGVLTCVGLEADIVTYFLIPSPHFIFFKKDFYLHCVHVYTMFRGLCARGGYKRTPDPLEKNSLVLPQDTLNNVY